MKSRRTQRFASSTVLAVAGLAFALVVPSALGAAPANDQFADAEALSGASGSATGSNVEATKEPGEPDHAGDSGGASVWYRWTAPTGQAVSFETCGSSFDTTLAVYTGSTLTALDAVAESDDACALGSRVTFDPVSGTTYQIAVDGFEGATGTIALAWSPVPAPANDDFAAAEVLSGSAGSIYAWNLGATKEPGEPAHAGNPGGHSIWYRWTAPETAPATFELCSAGFDTLLAVYTGTDVAALTGIAANDDGCGESGAGSLVSFAATAGTTYSIAIDGAGGASGDVGGTFYLRPPNDDFAAARALAGDGSSVAGSTFWATNETGEPEHAGVPSGASVWYRWTAPASGIATFDTCAAGPAFNTVLAAYTGSSLTALTQIAANDDDCGSSSRISFRVALGNVYSIAVAGRDVGYFTLTWSRRPGPPENVAAPAIVGSARVGATLQASTGTWTGDANSYAFQWQRCGVTPENTAQLRPAAASAFLTADPPSRAVDGSVHTVWNSGRFAPQWIEIDLKAPHAVSRIRLTVSQHPTGPTTHRVLVKGPGRTDPYRLLTMLSATTADQQPIEVVPAVISQNVRFVRVYTDSSPSWVAWRELEVFSDCVDVHGATQSTYRPDEADVDASLRVIVTATNAGGSDSASSATTDLISMPPPPPPARCVVPRVTGKTLTVAKRLIRRSRCRVGRVRRARSRRVRRGRVISQRPRAGRRLTAGARVQLVVSLGPRR